MTKVSKFITTYIYIIVSVLLAVALVIVLMAWSLHKPTTNTRPRNAPYSAVPSGYGRAWVDVSGTYYADKCGDDELIVILKLGADIKCGDQ